MHEEFIRQQIKSTAARDARQTRRLMALIADACWPSGGGDRVDPVALDWLRRWGPSRSRAALPACSCARGRCALCN
jgi:hypothetical protein